MPRRKTNEEWLRDVQDHVGDSYVFLQPYVNNKTKLACYHVDCGEIIYIRPDSITEGKGCNNCYGSHKRTQQQAKDDLCRVHGNKIVFAKNAKYTKTYAKIKVHCNVCNYEWSPRYVDLLAGHGCPKCYGHIKKTTESYQKQLDELYGHVYKVIGNYTGSGNPIEVIHLPCGKRWSPIADELIRQETCPGCGKVKKSLDQFRKELYDLVGDDYHAIKKLDNGKFLIKHSCGFTYPYVSGSFLYRGQRCPRCTSMTRGEVLVSHVLDELGIAYEYQKAFDGLVYKYHLRVDFYLPDYRLVIEYDGKQHYEPVSFGGMDKETTNKVFEVSKHRDRLKDKYFNEHNIDVLRIPYTANRLKDVMWYVKEALRGLRW